MSNKSSFTITLKNNATEKEGIDYLLNQDKRFVYPDKNGRKKIVELFKIPKENSRAFDLLLIDEEIKNKTEITIDNISHITLIELKTTKKKLPNNPSGFFFGVTDSEFKLADMLGNKFNFCFVCLNPECKSYKLLSLKKLNELIRTKRTQYQINL